MANPDTIQYSQKLRKSVMNQFESDGTILRLRAKLHNKIIKMIRGFLQAPLCAIDEKQRPVLDARLVLLNQLIMEYFNWFGYKHTMETFAMETDMPTKPAERIEMEAKLGKFELKQLPMLIEMLMRLLASKQLEALTASKQQTVVASGAVEAVATVQMKPVKASKTDRATSSHSLTAEAAKIKHKIEKKSSNCQNLKAIKKKFDASLSRQTLQYESQQPKVAATPSEQYFDVTDDVEPKRVSSELFDEVPEGHYYKELELPEEAYPIGFGEEGPCEILTTRYIDAAETSSMASKPLLNTVEQNAGLRFYSPNQWAKGVQLAKNKNNLVKKFSKA